MPILNIPASSLRAPSNEIAGRQLVEVLQQQLRGTLLAFPGFPAAIEERRATETFTYTAFLNTAALSAKQRADLNDGLARMEAFGSAIQADPSLHSESEWPFNRCIYSAFSLRDILHRTGRPDAVLVRSGLDVRRTSGEFPRILTIGDPSSPRIKRKWNAHLTVRLGDILLDPSFGQTKRPWNHSPHCAAFLVGAPHGHVVNVSDGTEARTTTLHRYSHDGHDYQISYFELLRAVDLRTRKWRNAPDARPKRRQALVRKAVAIHLAQIAESGREAA
ncbi:MAG: hypothetical protein AB7L90_19020 [Hyphomicrobiaceae bacterium]